MGDDKFDAAVAEAVAMATAEQKLSALERLRRSVLKERRWLRGLTIVSIVVGCTGIVLAVLALVALDEAESERAGNRVTSCEQQNEQQQRSIDGNNAQVREVFRSLTSDDVLTAEEQASLDRLFKDHDAVIERSFPMRDCSQAGIDAYFDDDPTTDPFVREDP